MQLAAAPGWKPLFNGRNLDGWEVVNAGNWTVENGQIVVRRLPNDTRGGWLVTKTDYRNFVVRLKFKPGSDAFNSGVLIRDPGHAKVSRPAFHGFEIQLQQGEPDPNSNAAIYDVARAYPKLIEPQAWSEVEVRCEGDHIETFLLGQKMAETHTRRSFFGAIGLQMHGGKEPVEYRFKDIEIRGLPDTHTPGALLLEEQFERNPAEFQNLWTSESLTDTFSLADQDAPAWSLKKGVLRGAATSQQSAILTRARYTDFLLTFDARVPKSSEAVAVFRDPSGYECAISESPSNPSGSVLGLAPGMITSEWNTPIHRPNGWNSFRIYVQGDHVVTYVNLSKTADVHASRAATGHIGFYVKPGSTVELQNVRIKVIR